MNSALWSIQGEVGHIVNTPNRIFREHLFSLDAQPFSGSHILLREDGAAAAVEEVATTRAHVEVHTVTL